MDRLGRWIVKYRIAVLVVTLAVVGSAGVMLPRLRIDVSSKNLIFVDESVRRAFNQYLEEWGSDRFVTMGVKVKDGDVFTHERLTFIRQLTERFRKVPMVDRVDSITNTSVMSARGDALYVGALVPKVIPTDPEALAAIRKRTMASPLLRRMFVDDHGQMVGINIRLRDSGHDERPIMLAAKEIRRIQDTVKRPPGVKLYQMGGPAMLAEMYDLVKRDVWVLGLAPIVLVGFVLLIVFRSLRGALFPLVTVICTGVITFGGMAATGHQVNMVTTMLPCLMMVIAVADVIHVLVQHREAVADGKDNNEAVVTTVQRVGLPCLLTSLTTSAGFGSLVLSDVPQVREFGIFAAVGVTVAMLLSIISVPAVLTMLPKPDPEVARKLNEGLLQRWLERIHIWGHHRVPVIAIAVLATGFGALGLTRLEAESSTREYLPKDHRLRMEFEMVESNLMGGVPIILHVQDQTPHATPVAVASARPTPARTAPAPSKAADGDDEILTDPEDDEVIDDPEAKPAAGAKTAAKPRKTRSVGRETLKRPAVLAVLDEIANRLAKLNYVRKTIAITEYLKEVNRVMHGGDEKHYKLPTDRKVIAAYLEMAAGQDRDGLAKLVNFEHSKANVTIMSAWPNTKTMRAILHNVQSYLDRADVKKRLGPGVTVEVTGMAPMLANVADRMVAGQIKSFFSALAVICLMMILMLWSFRVGLLAMIPNVLPILLTLGLMGWFGINLNVTTVMIASIALGIAVDDTIHMMVRCRNETRQADGDHDQGVNRALHSVGRAVVFTSLVLSGGFAILLMASLVPAGHFGIMVSITMLTALLADLVLTPTLIHWLQPWRRTGNAPAPTGVDPSDVEKP